jgi:hypothetical protein
MFALLIAPTLWSGYSVIRNTESSAPIAGPPSTVNTGANRTGTAGGRSSLSANEEQDTTANPAGAFGFGGLGGFSGTSSQANAALISYLEAHQGNTKFLVATLSSSTASPIILATNKPVMALGGFGGGDPILTVNQLQTLINNGTVRYFLLTSPRVAQDLIDQLPEQYRNLAINGNRGFGQSAALTNWVTSHCRAIPASDIESSGKRSSLGSNQLYDCAQVGS